MLDAMTDAPAWVRNGRPDILAMNQLARALYSPVLADPQRPANTTRFVYLQPDEARESSSTTTGSPTTPQPCCASKQVETHMTRPSSCS